MIGKVIQNKRKELGYTQAQLAELLQVTAPAVNRWEKNLSFPDVTLLAPLARCLKIDLNELFSFYDGLSETERDIIVKRIADLLFDLKEEEAFEYIDRVIKENLSDGLLYKRIAEILHGLHIIRQTNNPDIYMDRIVKYFESALSFLPEDIDVKKSLITIYGEIGERKKAEEIISSFREPEIDKRWAHIEMLYKLKEYDELLPAIEEYILKTIINLYNSMTFLKETFYFLNKKELEIMAEEKSNKLMEIFDINPIVKMYSDLSKAYATKDVDAQEKHIIELMQHISDNDRVSFSPLLVDIKETDSSTSDSFASFLN